MIGKLGFRRFLITLVVVLVVLLGGLWLITRQVGQSMFDAPTPETIAQASLQSMREQNRLTTFQARYVAVVTSTQTRFGLEAQKTMILPGDVRYELDLAALGPDAIRWDAATRTLRVTLPPIEVSQPQIDLNAIQEYSSGGLLMRFTAAENALDDANRQAATRSLTEQARQPMPVQMARDAAKRAIARNFALPLRAAGIEANVAVRFSDEPQDGAVDFVDRSTSIDNVMRGNIPR